jgi:hypothetical protein
MLAIDQHVGFVLFAIGFHQFGNDLGREELLSHIPGAGQVNCRQAIEVIRAPVGGSVSQPKPLGKAGLLARKFHALDVHGIGFRPAADDLRRPSHALAQHLPQPLSLTDQLNETQKRVSVSPFQGEMGIREQPIFVTLHGKGNGHPGRDGVQAQLVAEVVGIDNDIQVVIPAHRPKRVGGLVLGSFEPAVVLAVFDLADP